ncbi:MAG: pyridoxal-dependent decarboxylase [Halieaceae bacterium]|jgi:glutamate/tyrosine decarboxylase-like PLP-dependent enzyme|nr:pyridoxal-dependent decarboxylase [Halieaceae bacterium]
MAASLFLGPHGENAQFFQQIWGELLHRTLQHRRDTFPADGSAEVSPPDRQQVEAVEQEIGNFFAILQKEVPTFSNRYLGHMISDVSIPALIGNAAVLFCNPNLASKEVASAGLQIEMQAINALARMIGLEPGSARGHFTSGGTVANFEAFWRARFRLDHWLSMAAWLLEKGHTQQGIFELAHQGWDAFYRNTAGFHVEIAELAKRSYVLQGPWDIAMYYRDTLQREFPQPVVLVPGNKHYSWPKSANIFGVSEKAIWLTELDRFGRVSIASLRRNIDKARREQRPIMMNVSVAGTTELGTVDAVDAACDLFDEYRRQENIDIWHHVDAAYGGYFCSTFRDGKSLLPDTAIAAFSALARADSVTLDPHKLGFVPYACGAFLVRDPRAYSVSQISAPYLVEDKQIDHPSWSTTFEGSRSATGAGAVWLSARVLPLDASGHGAILNQTLATTSRLAQKLQQAFDNIYFTPGRDTNIVGFTLAKTGSGLKETNRSTGAIIDRFSHSPNFAISRTALGIGSYRAMIDDVVGQWQGIVDDDHLLVIRMVVMSPYLGDKATTDALLDAFIAELKSFAAPQ